MDKYTVYPSKLQGELRLPPSKSHTLRAILFAALAKGKSRIYNPLSSPDTDAMIRAAELLGAKITREKECLTIVGTAGNLSVPKDIIDCGNSGLVLRLIGALAGLIPGYTILTGDLSIRENRPVFPLLSALEQLGAFAVSTRLNGKAPIAIKGPFEQTKATLEGQDSQPVSGLLIAGAFAPHPIELFVKDPGEKPWIDLTLSWFKRLGIFYEATDYTHYRLKGGAKIDAFDYEVPGDLSSAAFPVVAALLTGSELTIHHFDLEDNQGDKKLFSFLEEMGALFSYSQEHKTLKVLKSPPLEGKVFDINDCIDALPILAVVGCFAKGCTKIINASIARKKESDRIHCIATELKKMGAHLEEEQEGLTLFPSALQSACVTSHQDHRLAMALTVACLSSECGGTVLGTECIAKTYPNFYETFSSLGAKIHL
jgi:3-phosphoshikimate 1-carboxyvinyltransferase